jgi:hypothetical protein
VKIIDEKIFVVENWGAKHVPLFSEILEIDGVPAVDLRAKTRKLSGTDLPHAQNDLFETLCHLHLTTYFDLHSPWDVKYRNAGDLAVANVTGVSGMSLYSHIMGDTQYKASTLTVGDIAVPVLEIPSFAHGDRRSYEKFVDEFFEEHRNSKYVVIDLRRNTGGNGVWGYYLLDHLTDSPYRIKQRFSIKVSDLFRGCQYRDKAGRKLAGARNGAYVEAEERAIRDPLAKMGTVIGQETSGKETFCSDPVMHTLPNTGLVVSIPVAVYALPGDNPNRGVVPDITVDYTIDDLRHGRNMELETIRGIVREEQ